ncbi:MAG: nucleoside recognition domain-containing protein [Bilophila wadsworthia]
MFTLVAILEDFGYMARMAYMLDRVFRAFGLHGASVMPFIIAGGIAGGCAIPGVMATRTLRSPKESWRPCSRFLIWRAEPNSPCFCCWWACSSPKTPPVPCSC